MKVISDPFQADLYAGQLVLLEATQSRTTSASSIVAILFCLGIATIYTLSGTKPLSHQWTVHVKVRLILLQEDCRPSFGPTWRSSCSWSEAPSGYRPLVRNMSSMLPLTIRDVRSCPVPLIKLSV